jgi:biotin carboxyl carrier protein
MRAGNECLSVGLDSPRSYMKVKQAIAVIAVIVGGAWLGWAASNLLQPADVSPPASSGQRIVVRMPPVDASHQTTTAAYEIEPAPSPPSTAAVTAGDPSDDKVIHVLDVTAPVDGRVERMGSTTSAINESVKITRALKPGDHVAKGQVLATIWSEDVGERKHQFVTAASTLLFDEAALKRLRETGGTKRELADARRQCEVDRGRLERAETILRGMMFSDEQIADLRETAVELRQGRPEYDDAEHWDELEVHAPHDAVVVSIHANAGRDVEGGGVLFRVVEEAPGQPDQLADSIEP